MTKQIYGKNLTKDMMLYPAFEKFIKEEVNRFYPKVVQQICEAAVEGTRGPRGSLNNSTLSLSSSRITYTNDKINTKYFIQAVRLIPKWKPAPTAQTKAPAKPDTSAQPHKNKPKGIDA